MNVRHKHQEDVLKWAQRTEKVCPPKVVHFTQRCVEQREDEELRRQAVSVWAATDRDVPVKNTSYTRRN